MNTPTAQQARALQTALKRQTNERNRLIAAGSDREAVDAATEYIDATDAAYLVVLEVKPAAPKP